MTERVFAMPDLGEGLEEGEVTAWLVAEGDEVELNQPLVEVDTAKATVEIPSPFAGRVATLHADVGDAVPVGAPLVTFEVAGEARGGRSPAADPTLPHGAPTPARPAAAAPPPTGGVTAAGPSSTSGTAPTPTDGVTAAGAPRAAPAVRKLAKDLGVDLAAVRGTGPGGRITHADVAQAGGAGSADAAGRDGGAGSAETAGTSRPAAGTSRRGIAAALERQAAIPQVTTFRTVDCTALEAFRRELGVSPLPVVVAALVATVAAHPAINAGWDGDVVERADVHVGIAIDTDRGLVVPVLRDAGARGVAEVAAEIARLADAARARSLTPADLQGATIAVSNTGSYASEAGTPILSPGTGVTLALGAIAPRALVVDDHVEARPACTLSVTFDHRVLDGATVGRAVSDLVSTLQSDDRLRNLPA